MLLGPLCHVTSKEIRSAQQVPTTHSGCVQDFHQDLASDGGEVAGVTVEVNFFVLIDVRCVYMFEFLGTGPPEFLVSFDTLSEEPRLVPFDSFNMLRWRTSLVGVDEFEFLLDLVFVECWGRDLDGSKVPLAAISRFRLLRNGLFDLNQEVAMFG